MADSKVSDLIAATSVNPTDVVYLVQSSTDKKLSISTLLANLPSVLTKFSGLVALGGTSQSISNTGAIDATSTVTYLTNSTNASISINNGSYDGQIKIGTYITRQNIIEATNLFLSNPDVDKIFVESEVYLNGESISNTDNTDNTSES